MNHESYALSSYHKAMEVFLQVMKALPRESQNNNNPNDLQLTFYRIEGVGSQSEGKLPDFVLEGKE